MIKPLLTTLLLAVPMTALAQKEDAPIPYGDEDNADATTVKPKKGKRPDRVRDEDESEKAGEETLAHLDDPNFGLGGDLLFGMMLFESAKGGGVDVRPMFGLRFTWEWGRLIPDEFLREMFFADITWQYAATSDGTPTVNATSDQHFFTLAPAAAYKFGKLPLSAYAQVGIGFNMDFSSLRLNNNTTQITGTKFLIQYGIGLRGRPAIVSDESIRIEWRVEITRFVRGYMHDMFLGVGAGVVF